MIAFTCSNCGKSLSVKEEHAGKRGACPHCKKPVLVPMSATAVADLSALGPRDAELKPPTGTTTHSPPDDTLSSAQIEGRKLDFLAPAQKPDELGRLGAYRVLQVLGAGGMGMVLRAEDPVLKRSVALKVMRPELAADAGNRQRFLREAQATAAVEHPYIIHILHVGQEGSVPYLVMPFLQGESLDARLKREKKLPVAEAVRIARQTAEGLAAAHEHGLVHRDIKPANLWLEDKTGWVKILDFGLARSMADDTNLTKSGTILGTPAYMAPEQAMSKPVDSRCDLFSLGAVLYRMLTGEPPFQGADTMSLLMALATETPRPIRELSPAVPVALADLVMQLLAKDSSSRPGSAVLVAKALAALEADKTSADTRGAQGIPRLTGPRVRFQPAPRRWIYAGAAGLVLSGAILLLLLARPEPKAAVQPKGSVPSTQAKDLPPTFTNSLGMEFVLVPKGKGWLAGGGGQNGTTAVDIKHAFYLAKYEVTQEEWRKVTGLNPSRSEGTAAIPKDDLKRFPVDSVSWDDCQLFVSRVNEQVKDVGWVYRLPTEAEWEYACRGGPTKGKFTGLFDYYFNKPTNTLTPEMANFGNVLKRTCRVGSYKPNMLGLYDMHGNVWEWCEDDLKDGKGASQRVARGGNYFGDAGECRAGYRRTFSPSYRFFHFGLRLARVPAALTTK